VISEQGSTLAYAVTEGSETGKSNDLCSLRLVLVPEVLQCSRVEYDSRTQTEGPSSYRYRIYSTLHQADTRCTSTCKATDPTSTCTSVKSQEVRATGTTTSCTIIKSQSDMSHSLCVIGG
jgi:hypothetical protein